MSNNNKSRSDKAKISKKHKTTFRIFAVIFIIIMIICFTIAYKQGWLKFKIEIIPTETISPEQSQPIPSEQPSETASVEPQPSETPIQTPEILPGYTKINTLYKLTDYLDYLLSHDKGQYGLIYYNYTTNDTIQIQDQELYVAASSTKVPMVMYVFHAAKEGLISLDTEIEYIESDFEYGTGIIYKGQFGDKYTVKTLCEYSLMYSDNCAINMLIRTCGEWNMVNYMNSLGATVDYLWKRWKTCPYDLSLYYKELKRLTEEDPEYYGCILDWLYDTTVGNWLSAKSVLPHDIVVASKIGVNNELLTLNDTILVYAKDTYILSYCSCYMDSVEESSEVLKKISLAIFEYVQNGYSVVEWDGSSDKVQ